MKGLTGVVIEDVGGKPFSEYGRYLADAGQVLPFWEFSQPITYETRTTLRLSIVGGGV